MGPRTILEISKKKKSLASARNKNYNLWTSNMCLVTTPSELSQLSSQYK